MFGLCEARSVVGSPWLGRLGFCRSFKGAHSTHYCSTGPALTGVANTQPPPQAPSALSLPHAETQAVTQFKDLR